MTTELLILFMLPPFLAIGYRWLEHIGVVDKITGRDKALEGLARLRSTAGFPKSWIYDKDEDQPVFAALEKRISKNTIILKMADTLSHGHRPTLITTAGSPITIQGVPPEWPQEERMTYAPNQPVMYIFDTPGTKTDQKGDKVCTLEELDMWLKNEKDNRAFWLGVVLLGLVSISLILVRWGFVS